MDLFSRPVYSADLFILQTAIKSIHPFNGPSIYGAQDIEQVKPALAGSFRRSAAGAIDSRLNELVRESPGAGVAARATRIYASRFTRFIWISSIAVEYESPA